MSESGEDAIAMRTRARETPRQGGDMDTACVKCSKEINKSFDSYFEYSLVICDNLTHIDCTDISYKFAQKHKKTFKCYKCKEQEPPNKQREWTTTVPTVRG